MKRIGRGPGAHLGVFEAEAVARDQQSAGRRPEEVADRRQRTGEGPQPGRALHERVTAEVRGGHHAPAARLGGHVAEQVSHGGGPAAVAVGDVVADDVHERVDAVATGEQGVEGVHAAGEAEGGGGGSCRRGVARNDDRPRRIGIPEPPILVGKPGQVRGPGFAHASRQPQRPPGVEGRHEQRRPEGFAGRGQRQVGRLKPHAAAVHLGRHAAAPAGDPRLGHVDRLTQAAGATLPQARPHGLRPPAGPDRSEPAPRARAPARPPASRRRPRRRWAGYRAFRSR
jgi:hypothetical protein